MGFLSQLFKKRSASKPTFTPRELSSTTPTSSDQSKLTDGHRCFLTLFIKAKPLSKVPSNWEDLFKLPNSEVTRQLIQGGYLEAAPLVEAIESIHSAPELKALAKDWGLPVSGNKRELAERLIGYDSDAMSSVAEENPLLKCSALGLSCATEFLAEQEARLSNLAREGMAALRVRDFSRAIDLVRVYESGRVKLPGYSLIMSIDSQAPEIRPTVYKPRDTGADLAAVQRIFTVKPKILKELSEADLESMREFAGLAALMDDHLPPKYLNPSFVGMEKLRADVAQRMFTFHLSHLTSLDKMKGVSIKSITVRSSGDSCDACKAIHNQKWPIGKQPELPYEHCTCEMGCRCYFAPEVDFS